MTIIPMITTIPSDPPSTDDPSNFDTRADAFLGDFPDFAEELNAMATAMNLVRDEVEEASNDLIAAAAAAVGNTDLFATSTSTIAVSVGTKTVLLAQSGKAFAQYDTVALIYRADPNVRLLGTIATVVGQTLTVDVAAEGVSSTGAGNSYASWMVVHTGFLVAQTAINKAAIAMAVAF